MAKAAFLLKKAAAEEKERPRRRPRWRSGRCEGREAAGAAPDPGVDHGGHEAAAHTP